MKDSGLKPGLDMNFYRGFWLALPLGIGMWSIMIGSCLLVLALAK